MYLTRLLLNPRSRLVQHDIGDRYRLHRTIMSGFPEDVPIDERVLYRVEIARTGDITLLVQSLFEPEWGRSERLNTPGMLLSSGDANPWVKAYDPRFQTGQALNFRLDANPAVKRDGKRHALLKEDQQSAWLTRKGAENGFALLSHQIVRTQDSIGRKESYTMKWHGVRFDGVLQVVDAGLFAAAVATGIGAAKGFGFGLLSVLPYSR